MIPSDDVPKEKSLGPLPSLAHGVKSDDVIIIDSKTFLIKNLYYDGAGPGIVQNSSFFFSWPRRGYFIQY